MFHVKQRFVLPSLDEGDPRSVAHATRVIEQARMDGQHPLCG
jgi:hypothetical protein